MNNQKKERREAQLAKKAETIKAYSSDIEMKNETEMLIDGREYVLIKNYRDGFQVEKLKERFSSILTKYDYIVGDWGYDQLRLRGFYKEDSNKGFKMQSITKLEDYLYEYCNFGCAYFILKNLDVKEPAPAPKENKRPRRKRYRDNQKNKTKKKTYPRKPRAEIKNDVRFEKRERKVNNKPKKRNKVSVTTVQNKKGSKRHFTIRQKD